MRLAGTCWNGPVPFDCVMRVAPDLGPVAAPPVAAGPEGQFRIGVLLGLCDDDGVCCIWSAVGGEV